jgi:ParB family chromosome partitioning protein
MAKGNKGSIDLDSIFGVRELSETRKIPLSFIQLSESQPRRFFDPEAMEALVNSIKADGILQPLLVRPLSLGRYEVVAGERRYRAALASGLSDVLVIIRDFTDEQALRISLIENLQRENLNPLEETEAILRLLSSQLKCQQSQVVRLLRQMKKACYEGNNVIPGSEQVIEIFAEVGKMSWQSFVANRLGLLKMPDDIQESLRRGDIEYTKAKAISQVDDPVERTTLLEKAISEDMSLVEIKSAIADLKDIVEKKESLKHEFKEILDRSCKSRAWDDPTKQSRLRKILNDLESVFNDQ